MNSAGRSDYPLLSPRNGRRHKTPGVNPGLKRETILRINQVEFDEKYLWK